MGPCCYPVLGLSGCHYYATTIHEYTYEWAQISCINARSWLTLGGMYARPHMLQGANILRKYSCSTVTSLAQGPKLSCPQPKLQPVGARGSKRKLDQVSDMADDEDDGDDDTASGHRGARMRGTVLHATRLNTLHVQKNHIETERNHLLRKIEKLDEEEVAVDEAIALHAFRVHGEEEEVQELPEGVEEEEEEEAEEEAEVEDLAGDDVVPVPTISNDSEDVQMLKIWHGTQVHFAWKWLAQGGKTQGIPNQYSPCRYHFSVTASGCRNKDCEYSHEDIFWKEPFAECLVNLCWPRGPFRQCFHPQAGRSSKQHRSEVKECDR